MGEIKLTTSEWYVLDALWVRSPQTVMELVGELAQKVGWAKSTTITVLRRMEEKGMVSAKISGKAKHYTPMVNKEDATIKETGSFLDRVYQGSIGLMISTMAKGKALSPDDVAQLREILDQMEGGEEHD